MYEVNHLAELLEKAKKALKENNPFVLKELSNQTVHSSAIKQDSASINLAVIIYSLSKLIERQDNKKAKKWILFEKGFSKIADSAIGCLKNNQFDKYEQEVLKLRSLLESFSPELKQYINEVIRKAEINKASHIYEHGLSMEQTSKLLGITQWELAEYYGQKNLQTIEYSNVKQRAKMALGFFS